MFTLLYSARRIYFEIHESIKLRMISKEMSRAKHEYMIIDTSPQLKRPCLLYDITENKNDTIFIFTCEEVKSDVASTSRNETN